MVREDSVVLLEFNFKITYMKKFRKTHVLCCLLFVYSIIMTLSNIGWSDVVDDLRVQNTHLSLMLEKEKYHHQNDHKMVQLVIDYIDKTADTGEMSPFVFSDEGGEFMNLSDTSFASEEED